ncbi:MAG TPA: porin family protein [Flavisolibacter sp.]|nr:porin family protein [Flavisolibacter sp.]
MKFKFVFAGALSLLLGLNNSSAQGSSQLRAGINLANVSVNDNGRVDDANSLTSFQVGFVGDVPLAGKFISLQPGVLFTGKGSKLQRGTATENGYFKQTSNPYYIEVPVNLVFKAPIGGDNRFFIGAGPYLGVGITGKNKTEGRNILGTYNGESDIQFSNDDPSTLSEEEGTGFGVIKRFDYGLNGTVGIEGKSIVLGVGYGLGLAKLQSGSNNNQDNNNKHRVLSFTVGFKL